MGSYLFLTCEHMDYEQVTEGNIQYMVEVIC